MQKPACHLLLAASLLCGLGFAVPTRHQHAPPPAPSQAQPPGKTTPTGDQLDGQEFREHAIRDSSGYDPTEALHDYKVGHFYRIQGDYPGALSRFRAALRHDPHQVEAMYEAGETEIAMHQPQQARDFFQQYLAATPHGKHAHHVQSLLKKLNRQLQQPAAKR